MCRAIFVLLGLVALISSSVLPLSATAQAVPDRGVSETQPSAVAPAAAPSMPYWREIRLWPEDSPVLQAGIAALAHEDWALTHPSILVYRPAEGSARSAVLVFPGGGYKALAIGPKSTLGLYGSDVCKWLTDAGITCVLVKYRVPNTGCNWNPITKRHESPAIPMALQDAQRAMSLVRYNAEAWGIDPNRIGVMGFSAGGNLAVLSSTEFASRRYAPADAADQVSIRPDFAIPVYPGHMTMEHKNRRPRDSAAARELNTDIVVSAAVPPTLLIHAKDDPVDPVEYSEIYEKALREAGANVRLIRYETGGHAFGVRQQGTDSDRWTRDAMRWLDEIGMGE
ncbi:alpha/beta hydrolase [Luteimonas sp. SJ-92]|uniref:Alpha/beta hydrolase n=1 Tax=Luteimonas salinisoli TaxID=2752307 RepID=A0A853JD92_9GAMM|nr:alpha/beta hydrolase [Luteimonas salinisoli]NZA26538.1 alpha/beta hydrolase [Luteimonas salinisoli]